MASNEFPIKLTISGHIERTASINWNASLYVCKSGRASAYKIATFWLVCGGDGGTTLKHTDTHWETFVGSNLKGQQLYICGSNVNGRHTNRWEIKIYTHYTMNAPTNVTVPSTANSTVTLSWTAGAASDGTLNYYQIRYRDRANSSAEWPSTWIDLTTSTTTSVTVSINPYNNGQRQYAVMAVATNTTYNSGWGFSGTCTSQFAQLQPGVIITKEQMDTLRTQRIAQMQS